MASEQIQERPRPRRARRVAGMGTATAEVLTRRPWRSGIPRAFLLMALAWALVSPPFTGAARARPGGAPAARTRQPERVAEPALPPVAHAVPDTHTLPGAEVAWDGETPHPRRIRGRFRGDRAGLSWSADDDPVEVARRFLRQHHRLLGLRPDLGDLALGRQVESLTGFHLTLQQVHEGLPVFDGQVSLSMDWERTVSWANNDRIPFGRLDARRGVSRPEAIRLALAAVNAAGPAVIAPQADLGIHVARGGSASVAWRVRFLTYRPPAAWEARVQAGSGQVLLVKNDARYVDGSGLVFDPNPIKTSGDPTLTDRNDADYPELNNERKSRPLLEVAASGFLDGPWCSTALTGNHQARASEPATFQFEYLRSDDRFEEVMCYYHIDTSQRYIQSLGFQNVNHRVQEIDANAYGGANAFYDPVSRRISMGLGDGGVDMSEDGGVVWHEYGHSIQDDQVPGWGINYEARAMGEGFGDYWYASTFAELRPEWTVYLFEWVGTIFNPYPFANPPYLRRLDAPEHYPEELQGEVHLDGGIWSACLWQIRSLLGRQDADRLVLQHHFLLSPSAEFEDGANALLQADSDRFGGAHVDAIRQIFRNRGILIDPALPYAHYEITHTIPTELEVIVGVGNPGRPTWARRAGFFNGKLVADYPLVGAEAYLPPSAAHPWFLRVADRDVSGSSGSLQAFAITYQGTTYQATDTPVTIADPGTAVSILAPGAGEPSLQLVSPTGGEEWPIGQTQRIAWTSASLDSQSGIQVELSRDDGGRWETLFASTAGDGQEDWTVTGPATTAARIRVRTLAGALADASDGAFQIRVPPPPATLTLLAPNGGEQWFTGSDQTIRWQSTDLKGAVDLDLSRDGGGSWSPLAAGLPATGSLPWTVTGPPTTAARVRVRAASDPNLEDPSDASFSIQAPLLALRLTTPNGGENWRLNQVVTIRWTASVAGLGRVRIELSTDDGQTWKTLHAATANDGLETWKVAKPTSSRCRVRITSTVEPTAVDRSEGVFRIQGARRGLPGGPPWLRP